MRDDGGLVVLRRVVRARAMFSEPKSKAHSASYAPWGCCTAVLRVDGVGMTLRRCLDRATERVHLGMSLRRCGTCHRKSV